jgi:hypothetical protein
VTAVALQAFATGLIEVIEQEEGIGVGSGVGVLGAVVGVAYCACAGAPWGLTNRERRITSPAIIPVTGICIFFVLPAVFILPITHDLETLCNTAGGRCCVSNMEKLSSPPGHNQMIQSFRHNSGIYPLLKYLIISELIIKIHSVRFF